MANITPLLHITQIQLKNFRCFEQYDVTIESPIVLLVGDNGTGKTSLLEALYYACFLRSFRTYSPKELIRWDAHSFFIKIQVQQQVAAHEVQVGFTHDRRLIKIDQKAITSYKELLNHYRIISVIEDDLMLVKGSPAGRRSFLDQTLILEDAAYVQIIRNFNHVLDNRNALLQQVHVSKDVYTIITQQLWHLCVEIQRRRIIILKILEHAIQQLIQTYFDGKFSITLTYKSSHVLGESFDDFWHNYQTILYSEELRQKRSLFGTHLDDFSIVWDDKKSKSFASRGQQKCIVLLLKIAQLQYYSQKTGMAAIFLLDDFMTDFDQDRVRVFLSLLMQLNAQLIFTAPVQEGGMVNRISTAQTQVILLTH